VSKMGWWLPILNVFMCISCLLAKNMWYFSRLNTMSIIRKARKGKFMNNLEKYHIFLANKQEIHMNEDTQHK
jgi:hypothetical protein